jgi:hypothetical protein
MVCPPESSRDALPAREPQRLRTRSWTERYGEKHRFRRVTDFPAGVQVPRRVRIYCRGDWLLLQWWDPGLRRNTAERVEGDLVGAIVRARQIEDQLLNFRSARAVGRRRVAHTELVTAFLNDLRQRADAGDIHPATVRRYTAALSHYLAFCGQPEVARACPYAGGVNRGFRLNLSAFLAQRQVKPNGRAAANGRLMRGQTFVLDTVRALYQWAGDPERGNLLPEGYHNAFLRASGNRSLLHGDLLAQPDITLDMAMVFIMACDRFQLRLFVLMLLFGLRAAEPCFLFREYLAADWLQVPCNSELNYLTKGRRSKRLPLVEELRPFWEALRQGSVHGLLYERRAVIEGRERAPRRGATLAELVTEFQARCAANKSLDAAGRLRLRDLVLREAGAMHYDHVEQEFRRVARRLQWPPQATLKDFRHLFGTTLGNTPMAEAYKKYLLGQSVGRTALMAYTHLNKLQEQYAAAVRREWMPLVEVILQRLVETGHHT